MKVKLKKDAKPTFSSVKEGDTFLYNGELHMRTVTRDGINGVNLATGRLSVFSNTNEIKPVDGEFVQE